MSDFEPGKLCRGCLTSEGPLEPLFSSNFSDIFILCTSLEAKKGDNFPQYICNTCLQKCKDWFDFKKQCEMSQDKFLNPINEDLGDSEYVALNYDDIVALSTTASEHIFIGQLSDSELIDVQEVDQTSDFEVDKLDDIAICRKCGDCFKNPVRLAQHVREKHAFALSEVCFICNKGFSNPRALRRHRQKHENLKEFQCNICDKTFKYATSLSMHVRKHQGDRRYVCQICSRAFFTNFQLETHLSVHQNDRPFECECGKTFKTEQTLQNHRVRHLNEEEKKFECEYCDKKFFTHGELLVHTRSHTNEKPFSCECGKMYKTASHLSVHQRIHTGSKPYSCGTCGNSFSVKGILKAHERTHTVVGPFSCKS